MNLYEATAFFPSVSIKPEEIPAMILYKFFYGCINCDLSRIVGL